MKVRHFKKVAERLILIKRNAEIANLNIGTSTLLKQDLNPDILFLPVKEHMLMELSIKYLEMKGLLKTNGPFI